MKKQNYWCKGGIYDPFNQCHNKHFNECRGEEKEVKDCAYRYIPHPSRLETKKRINHSEESVKE